MTVAGVVTAAVTGVMMSRNGGSNKISARVGAAAAGISDVIISGVTDTVNLLSAELLLIMQDASGGITSRLGNLGYNAPYVSTACSIAPDPKADIQIIGAALLGLDSTPVKCSA